MEGVCNLTSMHGAQDGSIPPVLHSAKVLQSFPISHGRKVRTLRAHASAQVTHVTLPSSNMFHLRGALGNMSCASSDAYYVMPFEDKWTGSS